MLLMLGPVCTHHMYLCTACFMYACLPACACSWQLLGPASSLSSSLDVPAWTPRSSINLGQLCTRCQAGAEVDFSGVLVWAGDVNTGVCGGWGGGCAEHTAVAAVLQERVYDVSVLLAVCLFVPSTWGILCSSTVGGPQLTS